MAESKQVIIDRLQQQILKIQGFKSGSQGQTIDFGLGGMTASFPNHIFPTAAIHEFLGTNLEDAAATGGFISALLAPLMRNGGPCLWISTSGKIFPPSLTPFGISPDRIIFIDLQKEKDVLWATEEALKCESLAAVITEIDEISFAQSRRLQLVIEKSRVTSFIIRKHAEKLSSTTAVARWKISSLPSEPVEGMPGLGFPRWAVELLKVKNGLTGRWTMEYSSGQFHPIQEEPEYIQETRKAV
ncbi:ImuA family protein [Pedobacter jamesrossensis]|uniref:ImuA family protein n=1 Tax=Pedobacter jamesrossensis TaxID=1908238 RepID=A0ABV8NKN9_9SPHI